MVVRFLMLLSALLSLSACAQSPFLMPEGDANSTAPGAAFTADGMHFRKAMPHRPEPHPWKFYYKNCTKGSDGFLGTKEGSYDCTEPF